MTSAKKIGIVLLALGVVGLVFASTACQKKSATPAAQAEVQKPKNMYEGTVKLAVGKYIYVPSAQGVDIIAEGFDGGSLVGKEIKVNGEVLPNAAWIFRADSIEVKQGAGSYNKVFTRSADLNIAEVIDMKTRETYQTLTLTTVNKPEEWEGKGKAKIFGKLDGGKIVVVGADGKEVGRILVDNETTFAKYYIGKLHLFDKMYFYINVKDSVEIRTRVKTKDLFHADVVFAGLY